MNIKTCKKWDFVDSVNLVNASKPAFLLARKVEIMEIRSSLIQLLLTQIFFNDFQRFIYSANEH